jgi:membrane fusion protein (multidrug efflux system)
MAMPAKKGRRKRALILGAIVLAVLLAIFGIRYFIWSLGHQETDDAYLTGHLHPISARVAGTYRRSWWTTTSTSLEVRRL